MQIKKTFFASALCTLVFFCSLNPIYGHDHWLMVENFNVTKGDEIQISLYSGHHYPKSSFGIGDLLISRQYVVTSDQTFDFNTATEEKWRRGSFTLKTTGNMVFYIEIKKPQLELPQYVCRLLLGNPDTLKLPDFRQTSGLEILPVRGEKPGTWHIHVIYHGERVAATCSIFLPDGSHRFYKAQKKGTSPLTFNQTGIYMISSHIKGTGASLVLFLDKEDHQ